MTLKNVLDNSTYVTDEDITDTNLLGMSNNAIAEVNAKAKTRLPFFTQENVNTEEYWAVSSFWVLRLIEPYISYSIKANDDDISGRTFHYNRFLEAINDFKNNGIGDIVNIYPDSHPNAGEETNFNGKSARMRYITQDPTFFDWGL